MPLVQAKCPNCGGILTVDNQKDAAVCQYCGTPFIVEKSITNYNISQMNVENATIILNQNTDKRHKYDSIRKLISTGNFDQANTINKQLLYQYPEDYEPHWFDVLIRTRNLTVMPTIKSVKNETGIGIEMISSMTADQSYRTAYTLAPEEEKVNIISSFEQYRVKWDADYARLKLELENHQKQEANRTKRGIIAVVGMVVLIIGAIFLVKLFKQQIYHSKDLGSVFNITSSMTCDDIIQLEANLYEHTEYEVIDKGSEIQINFGIYDTGLTTLSKHRYWFDAGTRELLHFEYSSENRYCPHAEAYFNEIQKITHTDSDVSIMYGKISGKKCCIEYSNNKLSIKFE